MALRFFLSSKVPFTPTTALSCNRVSVTVQMKQLFHNLLSNALKFKKNGQGVNVQISSHLLSSVEAGSYEKLTKGKNYCEILFKDNGIGFGGRICRPDIYYF